MLINLIMCFNNFYILIYNQHNLHLNNIYSLLFLDNHYNVIFKLLEILPECLLFTVIIINLIGLLYSSNLNESTK